MSSRPSSSAAHPPAVTPTVPPAIHQMANPPPDLIDAHLPMYLLPGVLDLLRESTVHSVRKRRRAERALAEEGVLPMSMARLGIANGKGKGRADPQVDDQVGRQGEGEADEVVEEELAKKVERMGLMVGGYVAEKLTLARPPLATQLDIIKFICKELFLYVYSKQIDNLRTNHRASLVLVLVDVDADRQGVFVLQSHAFPPLTSLSSYKGVAHDQAVARLHLLFPQALIQGALARLGLPAYVVAESAGLPQCTFQIRTVKSTQTPSTPVPAGTATTSPAPQGASAAQAGQRVSAGPPASTGLGIAGAPTSAR